MLLFEVKYVEQNIIPKLVKILLIVQHRNSGERMVMLSLLVRHA